MLSLGSLAPRALPRFPTTMTPPTPCRSRPGYVFPLAFGFHPHAGSPRFLTSPSTRAAPNHPGQAQRVLLVCPLLRAAPSSPPVTGFGISGNLATCREVVLRGRIGFTFVAAHAFAFQGFDARITPKNQHVAWSATVANEQLPRWTPFIPRDWPGLAWRTRGAESRRSPSPVVGLVGVAKLIGSGF